MTGSLAAVLWWRVARQNGAAVSMAVPVKRSLAGAVLASLPTSKLTSKRPLRGS